MSYHTTKEQTKCRFAKQTVSLITRDEVRNLRVNWAINPISDCQIVLRVVGLEQLIWNLAVDLNT